MTRTGTVFNHHGGSWRDGEEQLEQFMGPFVGRWNACVYLKPNGEVVTTRKRLADWPKLWERHRAGTQRVGMFPTRPDGLCRFGVLDLDAHDASIPDRHPEAVALTNVLSRHGFVAYQETSRSGRGVHVWFFFEAPGVGVRGLYAFLRGLADELRTKGPVDIYPGTWAGQGGAVLLPYFGGAVNVLDVDLKPVPQDKLEANPPSMIPQVVGPSELSWPPKAWSLPAPVSSGKQEEFLAQIEEGRRSGQVFQVGGRLQARKGYRNKIAGAVARDILTRAGSFEDFLAWDAKNIPPLARDNPGELRKWWKWAAGGT